MDNIRKYILYGEYDTPRRINGALNMFNITNEPKHLILINKGTHNFEYEECFIQLFNVINSILLYETNRFL